MRATCADAVFVDAADVLRGLRVVVGDERAQLVDALRVLGDVLLVFEAFLEDHMHHRVDQHGVGARRDRQVNVGKLRQHRHARIDDDQRELALFQRFLQPPVDDRVLLRQVGAERHQAVRVLEVSVAAGRAVGAERALVARHRRRHAQRGVAVVVVGADLAAHQLAERVELLGQQLSGGDHREGVAPILGLDLLDLRGGLVERDVPACRLKRLVRLVSRISGTVPRPGESNSSCSSRPLMHSLPRLTSAPAWPRLVTILPLLVQADLDRAAGRAVVAGRVLPFLHFLDRNGDRLAVLAAEEHVGPRQAACSGRATGRVVQFIEVEVDHAVFDLDAELRRAALVGRLGAAVVQADGPVVQRAGDALAEHDALRQRTALVRAAVEQREHLVLGVAKHRDVGARAGAQRGARRAPGCRRRGRWLSIGSITALPPAVNCRVSTAALSCSNHGSGSPSSANCSRSHSALRPSASSRICFFT